jgi:hypothetical protein
MDRLFQQLYINSHQIHPLIAIRIVRRVLKASHKLILKYISQGEWKKDQIPELLKLQNLYLMAYYANLFKLLGKVQEPEENYCQLNMRP